MKRLQQFISAFVLVIFSLYLVPHELVHELYGHHDTEHGTSATTQLSTVHVHCDFLSTDLINFLPGDQPQRAVCTANISFAYAMLQEVAIHSYFSFAESRGPPAA